MSPAVLKSIRISLVVLDYNRVANVARQFVALLLYLSPRPLVKTGSISQDVLADALQKIDYTLGGERANNPCKNLMLNITSSFIRSTSTRSSFASGKAPKE